MQLLHLNEIPHLSKALYCRMYNIKYFKYLHIIFHLQYKYVILQLITNTTPHPQVRNEKF